MEPKAFYSPAEVAEVLALHEVTVLRLLREGKIPAGKVGRQWRVSHAALEEMLGARIEAGKHPLAQPTPAPGPAPAAHAEPTTARAGRPEVDPGSVLDMAHALLDLADSGPERRRLQSPDALRDLRHAERILHRLRMELEATGDGGPDAAVRTLQSAVGAAENAADLAGKVPDLLPERIREEFSGDLLLTADRTRRALENLQSLERAIRNRL
jgi:excisionase family DNA binding protein